MAFFSQLDEFDTGKQWFANAAANAGLADAYALLDFRPLPNRGRVPVLLGLGPLADKRFDLSLIPGVGLVVEDRDDQLVLWKGVAGWDLIEEHRTLILSGTLLHDGTERHLRLFLRYSEQLVTRLLFDGPCRPAADDEALGVWPERILRFADSRKYFVTPHCPVRSEAWRYVKKAEPLPESLCGWRVTFVGDQIIETEADPNDPNKWASVGSVEADETVSAQTGGLAIWPPRPLLGWRLYTVHLPEMFAWQDGDEQIELWATDVANVQGKRLTWTRRNTETVVVVVDEADANQGLAPMFLAVDRDLEQGANVSQHVGGVFQLLEPTLPEPRASSPCTIAVDVGTSTTVVATERQGRVVAINLADSALGRPRVAVAFGEEETGWLRTKRPWLPTASVPGLMVVPERYQLDQIPTGIFVSSDTSQRAYPFGDFTFVGNALHPARFEEGEDPMRWLPELKWAEGREGSKKLEAFVTAVLLWVTAVLRAESGSVEVRATYPLAFSVARRKTYTGVLTDACAQVKKWSGVHVLSLGHWSGADRNEPFCDESTALVDQCAPYVAEVQRRVNATDGGLDPGFVQLVFHADLGGETLDTLLAIVDGEWFRILGAESTRVGADLLRDGLAHSTTLDEHLQRFPIDPILNRAIREDEIDNAIDYATEHSKQGERKISYGLSWAGGTVRKGIRQFQGRCRIYAASLLEHCARFIAGSLRDKEAMSYRIERAPGRGDVTRSDWQNGIYVAICRSGNGWKFLKRSWCAWSEIEWLELLAARVQELLGSDGPRLVVAWDEKHLILGKETAALGALNLVRGVGWFNDAVPVDGSPERFRRP